MMQLPPSVQCGACGRDTPTPHLSGSTVWGDPMCARCVWGVVQID